MSNITFEVPRLSTFVLKKSSERNIPDYIKDWGIERHRYGSMAANTGQSPNFVSMLGQIESHTINRH